MKTNTNETPNVNPRIERRVTFKGVRYSPEQLVDVLAAAIAKQNEADADVETLRDLFRFVGHKLSEGETYPVVGTAGSVTIGVADVRKDLTDEPCTRLEAIEYCIKTGHVGDVTIRGGAWQSLLARPDKQRFVTYKVGKRKVTFHPGKTPR